VVTPARRLTDVGSPPRRRGRAARTTVKPDEPVIHSLQIGRLRAAGSAYFHGMDDLMADELRPNQDSTETSRREALLDTAQDHLRNRNPEQAVAIWQQLISEGGERGDFAHLRYATYLFTQYREDEAWTELVKVADNGRVFSPAWLCAAEMMEALNEPAKALIMFSAATLQLTAEDLNSPTGLPWAAELVAGQRRVKWALVSPLDDFDLLGEMGDAEAADKYVRLLDLLGDPKVIEGRIQVWHRTEIEVARRLWPQRFVAAAADTYYRDVERALRAQDQRVTVIPQTYETWLESARALEGARSREELDQLTARYDEGTSVVWPPPRNQPCWCGSGTKYKKCCGSNAA